MSPETKTYTLVQPITIGSRTVSEMTFRPPVGKDIMELGNPFDILTGQSNAAVMGAMIGRLAVLEALFIERLSITDWNGCSVCIGLFLAAPGKIS